MKHNLEKELTKLFDSLTELKKHTEVYDSQLNQSIDRVKKDILQTLAMMKK